MKTHTTLIAITIALGAWVAPERANAQTHELYFHQTGALLAYAEAEVKILNTALLAKEFDPDLAKKTVQEIDRTLGAAKQTVDRVTALLPEKLSKNEPALVKLRELIKNTEDQLQRLGTDIEEQTAPRQEDEVSDELEEAASGPTHDWDLLKNGCGWLYVDLKTARTAYAKLAKGLRVKGVSTPKKPRGKRAE